MRRIALFVGLLVLLGAVYLTTAFRGMLGDLETPGEVAAAARPAESIAREAESQARAADRIGGTSAKQILFGDLHVHTTYSMDAFATSLPIMQGEGAHPPADACDFARYCSGLDFYSINDHAEGLTPAKWTEIKESVRQCNAVGDPASPDLVAFLGWEWTQMETTPEAHYGHKNVVLLDTDDEKVPTRPIAAAGATFRAMRDPRVSAPLLAMALRDFPQRQRYWDLIALRSSTMDVPLCPDGVPVRELPPDCLEVAPTPRDLFDKLDDWGFPALVIPHGNAWGNTSPAEIDWEKQLADGQHDPKRQTLVEVYSGHGSSEAYRPWRHVLRGPGGEAICPPPTEGFTPECHRAGEIIRERCSAAGLEASECEARAAAARGHFLGAGRAGPLVVPGEVAEDWLDAGQCRDCFQEAFQYRPGGSTQRALSLSGAGVAGAPDDPDWRFRFGLIASSDNHTARPASGYKEFRALGMTDSLPADGAGAMRSILPINREVRPESVAIEPGSVPLVPGSDGRLDSFFYTGGLVAVHAADRDRHAIWNGLERREVYGTSGPRILLWFDLLNAPSGEVVPMGGEALMSEAPRFRVRAVGSQAQHPGCPDYSVRGLGPDRLEALCFGECHHPGETRRKIERIEVVRIRPRVRADEDVALLIEDPWQTFECAPHEAGCTVEFEDPTFAREGRDAVYYVRALEQPTELVNGDPLRCDRDAEGACIATHPCRSGRAGAAADECLSADQPRAWSSPIFIDVR